MTILSSNTNVHSDWSAQIIESGLKGAEAEIYSIGDIGMPDKLAHLPNDDNWMAINRGMRYMITLDWVAKGIAVCSRYMVT